jgi:hypothetical protein
MDPCLAWPTNVANLTIEHNETHRAESLHFSTIEWPKMSGPNFCASTTSPETQDRRLEEV